MTANHIEQNSGRCKTAETQIARSEVIRLARILLVIYKAVDGVVAKPAPPHTVADVLGLPLHFPGGQPPLPLPVPRFRLVTNVITARKQVPRHWQVVAQRSLHLRILAEDL